MGSITASVKRYEVWLEEQLGRQLVQADLDRKQRFAEIASSRFRSADPWLKARKGIIVRRLAPNSRKLDFPALTDPGLLRRLLTAMGAELANLHSARRSRARAVAADLEARKPAWLRDAAGRVVEATRQDRVAWRARR